MSWLNVRGKVKIQGIKILQGEKSKYWDKLSKTEEREHDKEIR